MRRGAARAMGTVGVVLLTVTGCGGSGGTAVTTSTVGTAVTTSRVGTAVTTSTVGSAAPSAQPSLAGYLQAVDAADRGLREAADLVNQDFGPTGLTLRPRTVAAVRAVDLHALVRVLPAGQPEDLARRSLLVFGELSSRRAALEGVLRETGDGTRTVAAGSVGMSRLKACLANGGPAAARFARDRAALGAAATRPFTVAPMSSRLTGEMLLRAQYIQGHNLCCGSCGGYVPDRLAPVVWKHRTFAGGETIDGTIDDGVGFEASFTDGRWTVTLHAG